MPALIDACAHSLWALLFPLHECNSVDQEPFTRDMEVVQMN